MPRVKQKAAPENMSEGETAVTGFMDSSAVSFEEAIEIRWMPIQEALDHQADGNPKLHNIESLARLILRDGFTDPPKWDVNLNNGQGGFVFGNGRLEALAWLEDRHQDDPDAYPRPRGIGVMRDGTAWVLPVKIGVDSRSFVHAQQQLLDHNSIQIAGEFDVLEVARMYDRESYVNILNQIKQGAEAEGMDLGDQLTETVTAEDFSLLTKIAQSVDGPLDFQEPDGGISIGGEHDGDFEEGTGEEDLPPEAGVRMLQLFLDTETHPEMMAMVEALNEKFGTQNPTDCILHGMRQLYADHFGQSLEE